MSYNNTGKDKKQGFSVKNLVEPSMVAVLFLVVFMNVTNVVGQLQTVREAKEKNVEVKTQISNLNIENLKLRNRISFASSSAHLSQLAIDKLGLGTENDYWLAMPEDKLNYNIVPKAKQEDTTPAWKQWFWLFTKQENVLK